MSEAAARAVFLSYARDDAAAARRIAEALRSAGIEVWFDENELRGGDQWDAKIRKQIDACTLFVPVISTHTQERSKGYFRLEWKLAVDQTHLLAEGVPFIAPVVIDDTKESAAIVPPEFMKVQWSRLPGGLPTPQFVEQIKRLMNKEQGAGSKEHGRGQRTEDGPVPRKSGLPGWTWGALTAVVVGVGVALSVSRKSEPSPVATPATDAVRRSAPPTSESAGPQVDAKSIAVLPFVNMSGDKNSEYFSDGLTEEILNVLARNPALRVAARTSSFAFKDKTIPMDEIGRALRATSLIEGSVRKSGSTVRITVQLINAADGYHIWSETFTREITDIFAVQDEIAGKVAQKLGGGVAAMPVATSAPTRSPAAYDAYLRGRATDIAEAGEFSTETIRLYETAVRLDPGYALAWARLADVCARIYSSGFDRGDEIAEKARTAAAMAQRLDPNLPEAHLAQSRIRQGLDNDLAAARRELDLAERLRLNEAEVAAGRVRLAYTSGEWGDTFATLVARAVEADPQNAVALLTMAPMLTSTGRYAEAERLCDLAAAAGGGLPDCIRLKVSNLMGWTGDTPAALALLETTPESARTHTRFYYQRAGLRERQGDLAGALADYQQFRIDATGSYGTRSGPRNVAVSALRHIARIEARLGHASRAEEYFAQTLTENEILQRDFPELTGPVFTRALIAARRGQAAEAVVLIEEQLRVATDMRDMPTILSIRRNKAAILALLGRTEAAVAELRAVHDTGLAHGFDLRTNPEWESLHGDAQFQKLAAEAEARAAAKPRPKK